MSLCPSLIALVPLPKKKNHLLGLMPNRKLGIVLYALEKKPTGHIYFNNVAANYETISLPRSSVSWQRKWSEGFYPHIQ